MLEGGTADPAVLRGGEGRERLGQVPESQAAAAPEERPREVTELPSEPCRGPQGQRGQERLDEAESYADPRLRARRISIAIGISERMITITTTMWMCRLMSGIAWPSR